MPRTSRRSTPALPLTVLALMSSSAACGAAGIGTQTGAETCVSWVGYDTPADALADADAAVLTRGPITAVGTAEVFGADASVHSVPVVDVLKGTGVSSGQEVEVISTPVTCTGGETYPEGDPLQVTGTQVVFLHLDEAAGAWRTLTPFHGVVPAGDSGDVPATWAGSADVP